MRGRKWELGRKHVTLESSSIGRGVIVLPEPWASGWLWDGAEMHSKIPLNSIYLMDCNLYRFLSLARSNDLKN